MNAPVSEPETAIWSWPIDRTRYDQTPTLTPTEHADLTRLIARFDAGTNLVSRCFPPSLQRITQPLYDTLDWLGTKLQTRREVTNLLLREMCYRQTSFWAWDDDTWIDVFHPSRPQLLFRRLIDYRQYVFSVSYLLCDFRTFHALGTFDRPRLANRMFGPQAVEAATIQICAELHRWGYREAQTQKYLPRAICELLLYTRSPLLHQVTGATMEGARRQSRPYLDRCFVQISRALVGLGILTAPLVPTHRTPIAGTPAPALTHVHPEWASWAQRWRDTAVYSPAFRRRAYYYLLKAGRWLSGTHPDITHPAQWTRDLAAAYVAAVDQMRLGEWTIAPVPQALDAKPLAPSGKAHHLAGIRLFFRDCQEWGWIERRFDPTRSLATPPAILNLIGPNPRVIADDIWAKLLWAGLNLQAEDLQPATEDATAPREPFYPLELVRALILVWLFAGLRLNEIRRLRVGCMRWVTQNTPAMPAAEGTNAPPALCWLDIPVTKTATAFTKPVDRVVGEAILAWEQLRPTQPRAIDPKTGEVVAFLFSYRGSQVGESYLNAYLIPRLCQKAGVPEADARGPITTHRARSTIATQLYNAKEPLSLFELQEWLGHRTPAATQHYAKLTPTTLAKAYADADYFNRNLRTMSVLVDQEAVTSGAAAQGQPWKYYDLGHGYCSYDFFDQCPHRMACAKCAFYVPKQSSAAQVLEATVNLQHLLQAIPLTDEERAAVEDGVAAMEQLGQKLRAVPTPAGPTPQQLSVSTQVVIPLEPVRTDPSPT